MAYQSKYNGVQFEELLGKAASGSKAQRVDMVDTEATLLPNTLYVWGAVERLDLSLTGESDSVMSVYYIMFTNPSSAATILNVAGVTWPSDVALDDNDAPIFKPSSNVIVEIMEGLATIIMS